MTNDLTPFEFEGSEVRILVIDGEPYWVASDVASTLGYSATSAMTRTLDDDEKGVQTLHTLGGPQEMAVISESGLYSAILRSRIDGARRFKKWITGTVLPQIRKTGSYGTPRELTRLELIDIAREAELGRLAAEEKVAELEPKAKTFDTFLSTKGDYSVGEAAKILSREHGILTGEKRLFAFLLQIGWIYRDAKRKPIPYQAQVENGRLVAKARFWIDSETGEPVADAPQVRITAKGLDALRRKYLEGRAAS